MPLFMQKRTGEWPLGRFFTQYGELIGRQQLSPFRVGVDDREGFCSQGKRGACESSACGARQKTSSREHSPTSILKSVNDRLFEGFRYIVTCTA